jgi:Radical SAM superfamily/4Fe-4S single cluster domain
MRRIPKLEVHITHGCNLTCESCSHYSNQGHSGQLSLETFESNLKDWHTKIVPDTLTFLGGEPALHSKLPEFFKIARKYWPNTELRVITNGFYIQRHPTLPIVMKEVGNAYIYVSVHHSDPAYTEKIQPSLDLLESWNKEYGTRIHKSESFGKWTRRYFGKGDNIEPFKDNNPRASWEICNAKLCTQIFENKIWKCAPLAYLQLQDRKYNLSESWNKYLDYQPLTLDATAEEINAFFNTEDIPECGMCPAKNIQFDLPLPFK